MPIRFHIWLAMLFVAGRSIFGAPSVALIVDDQLPLPIPHGIDRLQGVLREKKITAVRVESPAQAAGPLVIVGMTGASGKASELLRAQNLKIPQKPESILIRRTQLQGKEAILVAG